MKPQPEDFQGLQALLASKRRAQPPAKYLERFAERVKERIENPPPPGPLTWRQKLGLDADWKPAIVCAWGVALCASLLIGMIVSLNLVQQQIVIITPGSDPLRESSPFGSPVPRSQGPALASTDSSTDPVFKLSESPAP